MYIVVIVRHDAMVSDLIQCLEQAWGTYGGNIRLD